MTNRIQETDGELRLAVQLRDYIRDRAAVEGVGFALPLRMFVEVVRCGASAFGVEHDGRQLLRDAQEPYAGYFESWLVRDATGGM